MVCNMNDLFEKLTRKKKQLDKYRPFHPELVKNLEEWLRVELTYSSNAIEGNTLTRIETAEILEKGITAVISGKPLRDQLEAVNHARAIDYIKELAAKIRGHQYITEANVLAIHKIILTNIDDMWAGKYRSTDVFIRGIDVEFPQPRRVPGFMKEFFHWLDGQQEMHPVKIASDAHFRFVSIHPFVDGNGRTSRLLMNLILLLNDYPMAIIRNEERTKYLESIYISQTKNDLTSFYALIEKSVDRSLDAYIAAVKGKSIIPSFMGKGELKDKNLLQIGKVALLANVPIPTIRYYVDEGLVKPEEKTKGGFMLFSPKMVEKIKEIKRLQQEKRLSIKEIRNKLVRDK